MKVQVLQHVPFEGLGSIEGWLEARDAEVAWTRFHTEWRLPPVSEVDLVIALGGPMSVNDEKELPWLAEEKRFVGAAIEAGAPVIGICLGAQLIAAATGARVGPGREREIGWFPIHGKPAVDGGFSLPAEVEVFHWHGETFELPPGAVHLASSPGCENQAFQLGERVLGFQFHLETTPQSAADIARHCRDELIPGPFVQGEEVLLGRPPSAYERINALMAEALAYVTR